jgi:RNA polymerase sigma factor (TIGR02999 family)
MTPHDDQADSRHGPGGTAQLLEQVRHGEASAAQRLMPIVYDELRALAARHMNNERASHTLQPTALVNEAYLRLVGITEIDWESRAHFLAVASTVIRRVLVDHARRYRATKRGGGAGAVRIDDLDDLSQETGVDLLALDTALNELLALNERQFRVVELRFFGGLSVEQIAAALDVSPRTVKGDWAVARAWLAGRLNDDPP